MWEVLIHSLHELCEAAEGDGLWKGETGEEAGVTMCVGINNCKNTLSVREERK